MKIYTLTQKQLISADIDTVWEFFSSPRNLNKITPPDMNFEVIDLGGAEEMFEGQLIKYKVCPFPFLRLTWITEIEGVAHQRFFTDSQKKGPFKLWHHRHTFRPVSSGVEMIDEISYSVPLGFLGRIINRLFVRKRVNYIFEYRREQIEILFPTKMASTNNLNIQR